MELEMRIKIETRLTVDRVKPLLNLHRLHMCL